ncbi:hypothetical protein [Candidatus Odyssella acanthamoebae]|uniref:Uncharacterized protein n=1 Tax=Candidatus Odyssella acanthamoebae TaxID=91604 RepID=A0A077AS39_9PROT|nr:hypothetical protein [Candidatus Paracaedibacter acanthamoebae]AIK95982.1 hypothetical protein ID47_03340 [Candidatus Paracaedibacter acanthamoebae]
MDRIFFSFYVLGSFGYSAPAPEFQDALCFDNQNEATKQNRKLRLAIEIYKATKRKYSDPHGIWDQHYLKENPEIEKSLKEFGEGKRGHSLARIQPEGKTAQALHDELVKEGFSWKAVPLLVDQGADKRYWKLNGEQTADEKDPDVVKMHIYTHRDGGMVRIKASGVPDKTAKYPKRVPHVVMAVLKNFDPAQCRGESCSYDTSYDNEAFKVTREGMAGPKAASIKYGFRYPFKNNTSYSQELNRLAEDIYMDLVHTNLKTNCPNLLE